MPEVTKRLLTDETGQAIVTALNALTNAVGGTESSNESTTTPTLIQFKINNTVYIAEDGMTWGEWLESDYCVKDTYYGQQGYFTTTSGTQFISNMNPTRMVVYYGSTWALINDTIINQATYTLTSYSEPVK